MGEESKDEQISNTTTKVYTLAEIAEHKTTDSCWIVIHDKVYDVTKFLDEVSVFSIFLRYSCWYRQAGARFKGQNESWPSAQISWIIMTFLLKKVLEVMFNYFLSMVKMCTLNI